MKYVIYEMDATGWKEYVAYMKYIPSIKDTATSYTTDPSKAKKFDSENEAVNYIMQLNPGFIDRVKIEPYNDPISQYDRAMRIV